MGKYSPLKDFLAEQDKELVPMSFDEIEHVLGEALPASKQYPAWWSNNPSNNVMTKEWIAAGYQTESVDIAGEKLVFRRVKKSGPLPPTPGKNPSGAAVADAAPGRLPFFGFMKGKMTIEPGYDISKPIDVEWGEPFVGAEQPK
jgi:hypothetical protein